VKSPKTAGDEAARWPLSFRLDICSENSGGRKLERFQKPFGLCGFADLDAMLPAAPEASSVSKHSVHLPESGQPEPPLCEARPCLRPDPGRSLRARFRMQAAPHWIPAPVPGCGRRGAFRPKFELHPNLPPPVRSWGVVSQAVLPIGRCPSFDTVPITAVYRLSTVRHLPWQVSRSPGVSGCDTTPDISNRQDSAAGAWRAPEDQYRGSSRPQFPGSVGRTMAANSQQGQYVGSPLQFIEHVKFSTPTFTENGEDLK
jgi:hypothetical protein